MAYSPNVLDEPITIWGLEDEDWVIIMVFVVLSFFVFGLLAGVVIFGGRAAIIQFKKDKPAGVILHSCHDLLNCIKLFVSPPRKETFLSGLRSYE